MADNRSINIYKITNLNNKKVYIGQTIQTLSARWKAHKISKGYKLLSKAIQKHGPESFKIQILETCDLNSADKKEKYWIKELNSLAPNGYNLSIGGRDSTFMGRKHTEKSKKQISNTMKERGHFPKKTPEIIEKMVKSLKKRVGKLHHSSKPIVCNETGQKFESIGQAGKELNMAYQNIWKVLSGKRKSCNGLTFTYEVNYGR